MPALKLNHLTLAANGFMLKPEESYIYYTPGHGRDATDFCKKRLNNDFSMYRHSPAVDVMVKAFYNGS